MNFKESKNIYLQIVERICTQILSGEYPEQERVPSVREYAAKVEVNANTVMRSYEYLQSLDIIFNKRGIGYFVSIGSRDIILQSMRKEFMESELLDMFKKIDRLDISIDTIVELYHKSNNNIKIL